MDRSKGFAVFFILIIAISSLSLIIVRPANALTIAKPSIPQFTLSNTGTFAKITVQNQPLVLTLNNESLYYNVRVKEHQEVTWNEFYTLLSDDLNSIGTIQPQSNSEFTEIIYSTSGYPENTSLDFQVIAMYGYYYTTVPEQHTTIVIPGHSQFAVPADGESGYSPTQTIVVNSPTPSPTTTLFPMLSVTPTLPASSYPSISFLLLTNALSLIAIAILLAVIIALLLLMRHRKTASKPKA
jgi:hypothetical protein